MWSPRPRGVGYGSFHLQIVTPDGNFFDGEAESLLVRSVEGDVCILPGHCDYVTALGMGEAQVVTGGARRFGACIGGMLAVTGGRVRLVPTTFEWAEQIDVARAARSEAKAREQLGAEAQRPGAGAGSGQTQAGRWSAAVWQNGPKGAQSRPG